MTRPPAIFGLSLMGSAILYSGMALAQSSDGFGVRLRGLSPHLGIVPISNPLIAAEPRPAPVMLSSLYKLNDGWHMTTYVGADVRMLDGNDRLLAGASGGEGIAAYQFRSGIGVGLSGRLFGALEYSWTKGEKPHLSLAGVPAKFEITRHGVIVGMNYHF